MTFEEIAEKIGAYQKSGKQLFATSSFQTHSIPMLHVISRVDNSIPIYFINTGFHFPETIEFRDKIAAEFKLNLKDVRSMVPRNQQKDEHGNFYFTSDPDRCCYLNKTQPMEPLLAKYDVWINGVRADQNANRRNMQHEQEAPNNTLRFHPMLEWTSKDIFEYRKAFDLPRHPLEDQGYFSIGCEPCTQKMTVENERGGRWFGLNKTECGLHTDLVKNKE